MLSLQVVIDIIISHKTKKFNVKLQHHSTFILTFQKTMARPINNSLAIYILFELKSVNFLSRIFTLSMNTIRIFKILRYF